MTEHTASTPEEKTPAIAETSTPVEETPIPENKTLKPVKNKIPSKGFSLLHLEKRITATFSIMAKLFIIGLISVAVIFIGRELSHTGYAIKQVHVPSDFEAAGYTGPEIANRISGQLADIITKVRDTQGIEYINPSSDADVSVDLVGVGVPVKAFIGLIGDALGIQRSKSISAGITTDKDTLVLTVRISDEAPERFTYLIINDGKEKVMNEVVLGATKAILKYTAPDILSVYNDSFLRDNELGISLAKYMLARYKGDLYYEPRAYEGWCNSLLRQGKVDAAEEKVSETIQKFPEYGGLYKTLGAIMAEKNDIAGALEADKKSILFYLKDNIPQIKLANTYSNLGYDFIQLKQSDSAIYYLQKSIDCDNDFGIAFFNMGVNYLLLKRDTTKFLEYFEACLGKTMPIKAMLKDPDLQGMLPDARVQALLKKYEAQ
jgi:hypothetical protein